MKEWKFWRLYTICMIVGTSLLSAISMAIFFLLPNSPISQFNAISALPLKYIAVIIIGGLGKDFFLGFFTLYGWNKWQTLKENK